MVANLARIIYIPKLLQDHPLLMNILKGEFNGNNVTIYVQTVNNRVWRIAVLEQQKIQLAYGEKLTNEEDISYEITVHKKDMRQHSTLRMNQITVLFGI